jgi:hypothetical protein
MFVSPPRDPPPTFIFSTLRLDRTVSTDTSGVIASRSPIFLGLKAEGQFRPLWAPVPIALFVLAKVIFGEQPFVLITRGVRLGDIGMDSGCIALFDLLPVIEAFVG